MRALRPAVLPEREHQMTYTVTITDRHPHPRRWGETTNLARNMEVGETAWTEDNRIARSICAQIRKLGHRATHRSSQKDPDNKSSPWGWNVTKLERKK